MMRVAEKLEQLMRHVPGVAGYQDQETSRETDKAVRLRLSAALDEIRREIEIEQRQLTERHVLDRLAVLGRLSAKLAALASRVKYASRGYRGLFDTYKLTQETLDQLYTFDMGLFAAVEQLRTKMRAVRTTTGNAASCSQAIDAFDRALDEFETAFARRSNILVAT
ncbi:MAG: hypothetical protein ACE5I7_16245 [Candidatus Binatia bacterium]